MSRVIQFPDLRLAEVSRALEHALSLSKSGRLTGLYLSYAPEDGVMYDCIYACCHRSAIMLLGQSQIMRIDLIGLAKRLEEQEQ